MNSDYEVVLSSQARKTLAKVDRNTRERLARAIEGLRKYPPEGDIWALVGRPGQLRCRVGQWRIIFRQDRKRSITEIGAILQRGEAYKKW